jgi:hypothetical protein
MDNKKVRITFEFDLSFDEDIENVKEQKVDVKAMKEYITKHVKELEDHTNYATTIGSVEVFKKPKKVNILKLCHDFGVRGVGIK